MTATSVLAHIVQLPFPATQAPHEQIAAFYASYEKLYSSEFPSYFIPEAQLWELPLWVSHLTALLDHAGIDSSYIDLSQHPARVDALMGELIGSTSAGDVVLLSPLAQNFQLALDVSARVEAQGRRVVIGGNMAPLVPEGAVHVVHQGQMGLDAVDALRRLVFGEGGVLTIRSSTGRMPSSIEWVPSYRHFGNRRAEVPLLRLNASHGCLYRCQFCGDAWSSQLTTVDGAVLAAEVRNLVEMFPRTRMLYIGDKTFGQSRPAVESLKAALSESGPFDVIAQTHVLNINERLISDMQEMGVKILEIGFESADAEMLTSLGKATKGLRDYEEKLARLRDAGIRPVLNVLGGLWAETEKSHDMTVRWLSDNRDLVWLCNIYNFVPYPLTPAYPQLASRIVDWDFAHWREDMPPVYAPYHLTIDRSWELFLEKVSVVHDMCCDRLVAGHRA